MRNGLIGSALLLLACAGCAETDPYQRQGMWQPEGVNAGNLAMMVERRSDLIRGRSDARPERFVARDAVQRLWEDRVRPLSEATSFTPGSTNSGKESH